MTRYYIKTLCGLCPETHSHVEFQIRFAEMIINRHLDSKPMSFQCSYKSEYGCELSVTDMQNCPFVQSLHR